MFIRKGIIKIERIIINSNLFSILHSCICFGILHRFIQGLELFKLLTSLSFYFFLFFFFVGIDKKFLLGSQIFTISRKTLVKPLIQISNLKICRAEGDLCHLFFMLFLGLKIVGAFSGKIGLPPAVTGWAASCGDGPQYFFE